jgi:hypothetical protein
MRVATRLKNSSAIFVIVVGTCGGAVIGRNTEIHHDANVVVIVEQREIERRRRRRVRL